MKKLLIFFLLLSTSYIYAQAFDQKDLHFVSVNEHITIETDNDGNLYTKSHINKVIKYNTAKGLQQMRTYNIYFSSFESVTDLSAEIKLPNQKKSIPIRRFAETNSPSAGIFFDDSKQITVDLTGIDVGAEVTIDYYIKNKECHFFHPFYFHSYLPVANSEYRVTIPTDIQVKFVKKNLESTKIDYTVDRSKKYVDHIWTAKELPEYEREGSAPPISYTYPHIIPIIQSYEKDGKREEFLGTVAHLYKWYRSNMKYVNRFKDERVEKLAKELTEKLKTDDEKIKAIYDYTKENIKYVAFEDGWNGLIPRDAKVVYNKKYGDCKDLSCFMEQMLKAINIPSYPTWIGTRSISYTYEEVPTKNSDNHMILAVPRGKEWIFLDATDPAGIYGLPTDHIQGKQALIGIDSNKFELVTVPVVSSKTNIISDTITMEPIKNDLNVQVVQTLKGLMANNLSRDLRYKNEKEKAEFIKEYFKTGNENIAVNNYDIQIVNEGLLIIKASYVIKDCIRTVADETYLNYHLNKLFTNSYIDIKSRKLPIEYERNFTSYTTYKVKIPAGKKLEYYPEGKSYQGKNFNFEMKTTAYPNLLEATQKIEMNFDDLIMKKSEFSSYNEMLGQLNKQYTESIIIK